MTRVYAFQLQNNGLSTRGSWARWGKNPQVVHVVFVFVGADRRAHVKSADKKTARWKKKSKKSDLPCEESGGGGGLHDGPLRAGGEGHIAEVVLRVAVQFVRGGVHACEQRRRVQHYWARVAATTVQARGTAAPHGRRQRRGSRAALRVHPGHFCTVQNLPTHKLRILILFTYITIYLFRDENTLFVIGTQ